MLTFLAYKNIKLVRWIEMRPAVRKRSLGYRLLYTLFLSFLPFVAGMSLMILLPIPTVARNIILLVLVIYAVDAAFMVWYVIYHEVIELMMKLRSGMKHISDGELDFRLQVPGEEYSPEARYLCEEFNNMAEEVALSKAKDRKMFEAEMDNFRLQVNPHMLLNSYNMIYALAQTKKYEAIQNYTMHLVEYFRYVLREKKDWVPLSRELQFIMNLVEIQKMRYPNAAAFTYDIDSEAEECLVLPLLIENFVENALKYAMIPGKTIDVMLNAHIENGSLVVTITDTGNGMKPDALNAVRERRPYVDRMGRKHIGIWNCRRRMQLYYGDLAQMNIISTRGSGTQVWMMMPYTRDLEEARSFSKETSFTSYGNEVNA